MCIRDSGYVGLAIIYGAMSLFWFVGVHGPSIVEPAISAALISNLELNMAMYLSLIHISSSSYACWTCARGSRSSPQISPSPTTSTRASPRSMSSCSACLLYTSLKPKPKGRPKGSPAKQKAPMTREEELEIRVRKLEADSI